jgi:hypothetical protein
VPDLQAPQLIARVGVVVAGVTLLLACIAGASNAELPRGWWKGTIVLEERWDQVVDNTGVKFSEKGSATVRITRTAPDTAAYEVTYREETRWLSGDCAGALQYVRSASFENSGPIDVSVSDQGAGAQFTVSPGVKPSIAAEYYECGLNVPERYEYGKLNMTFTFRSKQPDDATSRQGSGSTDRPVFFGNYGGKPRAGGINTSKVTWNLKLVQSPASSKPVTLGGLTLTRPRPSFVYAEARLTQGGQPVSPKGVTCTQSFLSEPGFGNRRGPGQWKLGAVRCAYAFNNRRYEGKTMAASVTVNVGTARFVRRFTVRIGSGTSLSAAKGAVVSN